MAVGAGITSSTTPVGASPYCRMSFRLAGMPRDAAVLCTGWACNFTVASSRVFCPLLKCECPKGCSNGAAKWGYGTVYGTRDGEMGGEVGVKGWVGEWAGERLGSVAAPC